ncbi:MAG: hypothetical protein ACREEQ_00830 [Caulobacteraceae bacterium]
MMLTEAPAHLRLAVAMEGEVEMTQTQRDAILEALDRWTEEATASRAAAREHLIRDGFYTADGRLTAPYGGEADRDD